MRLARLLLNFCLNWCWFEAFWKLFQTHNPYQSLGQTVHGPFIVAFEPVPKIHFQLHSLSLCLLHQKCENGTIFGTSHHQWAPYDVEGCIDASFNSIILLLYLCYFTIVAIGCFQMLRFRNISYHRVCTGSSSQGGDIAITFPTESNSCYLCWASEDLCS
ncbi:uncharacterized protein C8R40DRAFT_168882 [Lentinula edodes]|uniref:uncharacterized protein n=1 Tax=Lentinula edodes TaxID=5353 RepID=UPI001E8EE7CA|nr:uncharacterized protein C8R40DRAFT_168882 [Lentinula edodes]KAH7875928.1 hypothetical protein C8R40DRAFT_168882 [Lentinula edodes]